MCKRPIAGVVWQTLHYLLGLRRLGLDVYYAECHGKWVPNPVGQPDGSYPGQIAVGDTLKQFGMSDRWFCWADRSKGLSFGMSHHSLLKLYQEVETLINLCAQHVLDDDMLRCPRRVYLESDPGEPQILLSQGDQSRKALLDAHTHYFTFGENLRASDCLLPIPEYAYRPTRQPVLLDMWNTPFDAGCDRFTTIAKWAQRSQGFEFGDTGDTYYWSKHLEFLRFIELPQRTTGILELALDKIGEEQRSKLRAYGWAVSDAVALSSSLCEYQRYIQRSRGEFTVAKDVYVRLRSGWFSDRSACYLAGGKPVITQDTGFGNILPTGRGLFAFRTMEDILAALDSINGDYPGHCRAAREIAAEYFDSHKVLQNLLNQVDL